METTVHIKRREFQIDWPHLACCSNSSSHNFTPITDVRRRLHFFLHFATNYFQHPQQIVTTKIRTVSHLNEYRRSEHYESSPKVRQSNSRAIYHVLDEHINMVRKKKKLFVFIQIKHWNSIRFTSVLQLKWCWVLCVCQKLYAVQLTHVFRDDRHKVPHMWILIRTKVLNRFKKSVVWSHRMRKFIIVKNQKNIVRLMYKMWVNKILRKQIKMKTSVDSGHQNENEIKNINSERTHEKYILEFWNDSYI